MKRKCEKPISEMSFRQRVFGKCHSEFVRFGKKYIWEMSIIGISFEVMTVNHFLMILIKNFLRWNCRLWLIAIYRAQAISTKMGNVDESHLCKKEMSLTNLLICGMIFKSPITTTFSIFKWERIHFETFLTTYFFLEQTKLTFYRPLLSFHTHLKLNPSRMISVRTSLLFGWNSVWTNINRYW